MRGKIRLTPAAVRKILRGIRRKEKDKKQAEKASHA